MNGFRERILAVIGIILAATFIFSDFLAMLSANGGSGSVNYVIRLLLLASVIVYAVYLKYESFAARYKLEIYRDAWRQIPCGIAVFKNGKLLEICVDGDLFGTFGMIAKGKESGHVAGQQEKLVRTEEYRSNGGDEFYADRFLIPLKGFNGGGYMVELLVDTSEREKKIKQLVDEYLQVIKILVNIFEMKDPYSQGHSEVVSNLAQDIARALKMPEKDVTVIAKAALFHDIGKIVVPSSIISKTGVLAANEYDIIQMHPKVGAQMLDGMEFFKVEAQLVRHHHERFDGYGYPDGLAGKEIPLGARIIAVADTFDAVTAGRSNQGKRTVAEALNILQQEKGNQFDPEIVDAFVDVVLAARDKKAENQV